jgi:hypothetical protein
MDYVIIQLEDIIAQFVLMVKSLYQQKENVLHQLSSTIFFLVSYTLLVYIPATQIQNDLATKLMAFDMQNNHLCRYCTWNWLWS